MSIISEVFGNILVVHSPEYLGDDQAKQLYEFTLSRPQNKVVIDFDATEVVDSKGLSVLLDIHDRLADLGGDLKISTASKVNQSIFEITRMDKHIDVFSTMLVAVKSFQ